MDHSHPPSLSFFSSSFPANSSPSFHRPPQFQDIPQLNEKAAQETPLTDLTADRRWQSSPHPSAAAGSSAQHGQHPASAPLHHVHSQFIRQPSPIHLAPTHIASSYYTRPRNLRIANLIRSWLPLILYAITSLAFVFAIAFYRTELFAFLDELSIWLRTDENFGHAVLFSLIFLTTFPPIPLYSTLITLSGYTFGAWTGAIISYFAALTGALTVFIISRTLLRETISRWLASTVTIKRVVRAIEKRPKLLFLIRLAPYPYNVMNCLLAASPTLTLRTYTLCTALSLFKVIIHTSLGASIHSFKDYHVDTQEGESSDGVNTVAHMWTIIGIILCIAILVYLSVVARRAVDEELEDEAISPQDSEETLAFLSPGASDVELGRASGHGRPMAESPFRPQQLTPYRQSVSLEPESHGQWT